MTVTLSAEQVRAYLVSHLGLARSGPARQAEARGVRAVLGRLRAIQLDPLEPIAPNAELVLMARIPALKRADAMGHLLPGHAFEHFAKERCVLPASAFPYYRDQAVETPWWRSGERKKRIDPALIEDVLAEVAARGPLLASELSSRGRVEPIDWSGWKGTSSAASMALEILWTQCRVVVTHRRGGKKRYDVPQRALPAVYDRPITESFTRWALRERAWATGLLTRNAGPQWSMLSHARSGPELDDLIEDGTLLDVAVEGSRARYLAPAAALHAERLAPDDRMRLLGPLDPLMWDRALVRAAFGFEYLWEVYKPEAQRRWGWYVCPLLHRGALVGRIEAKRDVQRGAPVLRVTRLWREHPEFDEDALDACLADLGTSLGLERVLRDRSAKRR